MSKYIDTEKLIAEIRRIVKEETPISKGSDYYHGVADTADKLLSFIDSLQQESPVSGSSEKPNNLLSEKQEQPEVDLEKEVDATMKRYLYHITCREEQISFARHFYELGLKARKEE